MLNELIQGLCYTWPLAVLFKLSTLLSFHSDADGVGWQCAINVAIDIKESLVGGTDHFQGTEMHYGSLAFQICRSSAKH